MLERVSGTQNTEISHHSQNLRNIPKKELFHCWSKFFLKYFLIVSRSKINTGVSKSILISYELARFFLVQMS